MNVESDSAADGSGFVFYGRVGSEGFTDPAASSVRVEAQDGPTGSVQDHTVDATRTSAKLDVLFYGRASRDRSGKRSSVTTQESRFDDLLRGNPWEELGRFVDNDVSASKKGVTRPQFERMMKLIARGDLRPQLIVAYDISRLLRNRRDKIRLEQLIDSGIHLYDIRYRIDTRDKIGRILFAFMAEMAIDRAQELAEYQRDYHERRRESGKPARNACATGYAQIRNHEGTVVGFTVDPQYAKAVRWAVKHLRAGGSINSTLNEWNDPNSEYHIKPQRAKRFTATTLRKNLCSARIAGCVDRQTVDENGNVLSLALIPNKDGTLPAIVSVEDVLAMRERFKLNGMLRKNGGGVGRHAKYLLSGIAECDQCGAPLYGVRLNAGSGTAYQCMVCRGNTAGKGFGPSIRLDLLDEFVTGATFERLRSGALGKLLAKAASANTEVDDLAKQIAFEEGELQRFEELVATGEGISPERYLSYTGAKEARLTALRTKLVEALASSPQSLIPTLPTDLVEDVERYWEHADLQWKRRLVRLCFERIVVHRSGKGKRTAAQSLQRVELFPRGAATSADVEAGLPERDDDLAA
jgi:DNA invertase Pin-like site-specific DNA recombinase